MGVEASIGRGPWRFVCAAVAAGLALNACTTTPTPSSSPEPTLLQGTQPTPVPTARPVPTAGGTIYLLTQAEQFNQVDPQRIYTGEDLAFFGGTIMRSLTSFQFSADATEGTRLVPDMATDLGTATEGGRTWSFTLRPGVTWQDGADVTCEDIRYGVSRSFATDMINQGPTYAIVYLDIPTDADGSSAYKGPYTAVGQDLYDKAVVCNGRTITFRLNRPVADFNYTTTLGFSPVPKAADTGETYGTTPDSLPVSNGPYKVDSYSTGAGGRMILSRNEHWDPASDPFRKAYPDGWEVEFAIDLDVLAARMMNPIGNDAMALMYDTLPPKDVHAVFADPETPRPEFVGRAVAAFDPYVRYFWINVRRVANVKIRQAMLVALDREAVRKLRGGVFLSTFADGVIKPNIGQDYAPTGIWDTFFGQVVPDTGDPELARKLIEESGEIPPTLKLALPDTPVNQKIGASVIESLGRAGITVELAPICNGYGCGIIFNPYEAVDLGSGGWGADWPNASTVIPSLFTQAGGWDLSQVDDVAFNAAVAEALATLDREDQAGMWQALNRRAVENAWIIPTSFSRSYSLAGTNVGPIYRWPAYSSWPYGVMYVTQ